jgi:hypothetical protein
VDERTLQLRICHRASIPPRKRTRREAPEQNREGVPLVVIHGQLGHSHLGITSVDLQGIDNGEIIDTVHAR